MSKILNFPSHKAKKVTQLDYMSQPISAEEAVNELTHQMLTEVIRIYIDNRWSFQDLDMIVGDFRELMMRNAPEHITRAHVEIMKDSLRPMWDEIVESIRSKSD